MSAKVYGQGMAVNTSGAAANSSAMLDVSSTTQGMLAPRMTAAQKSAIAAPATGLLVYQTDGTKGFYYYDGSAWTALAGGSSSSTAGTGISPTGIPYSVVVRNTTSVGALYMSPTASITLLVASGVPSGTAYTFNDCHPTLTAVGSGASGNFPLTVNLVEVTYSTSSLSITTGTSLGSCVIASAGGTCTIDQSGATLHAGKGATISLTSGANPLILTTAFSCD